MDIRKYGIMIAVAILTAIFAYAVADAIAPQVDWNRCNTYDRVYVGYEGAYPAKPVGNYGQNCSYVPIPEELKNSCQETEGQIMGEPSENGCVESYVCDYCQKEQQDTQEQRSAIIFYTMIILGLIFIVVGFMLPVGSIHEWVGVGFILGGVISLFIGTVAHWSHLARLARPFVIALELAVVLFIVYRKMRNDAPATETRTVKKRGKR